MTPRIACLCILMVALCGCRKPEAVPASPAPATGAASPGAGPAPADSADRVPSVLPPDGRDPRDIRTSIPSGVFAYHEVLESARRATGKVDLPALWELERKAVDELGKVVESLSESDFARAETLMAWHVLCREEVVYIAPVNDSFLRLARRSGTPADTAYFGYMGAAHDETGIWRWDRQVTDNTACQDIGSPDLFASLRRLVAIQAGPRSPYARWLPDPAEGIREDMKSGLCSCANHEDALRAFEQGLATFPKNLPVHGLLDSLHETLRTPRPIDRYECSPS